MSTLFEQFHTAPTAKVEDPESLTERHMGAVWIPRDRYTDLGPQEDEIGLLAKLGPYGEVQKVILRVMRCS